LYDRKANHRQLAGAADHVVKLAVVVVSSQVEVEDGRKTIRVNVDSVEPASATGSHMYRAGEWIRHLLSLQISSMEPGDCVGEDRPFSGPSLRGIVEVVVPGQEANHD